MLINYQIFIITTSSSVINVQLSTTGHEHDLAPGGKTNQMTSSENTTEYTHFYKHMEFSVKDFAKHKL